VELRMLFEVKSKEGRGINISGRGNRTSRAAGISMVRIQFFRAGERDLMMMMVGNKEVYELF
jgi:hypothetical protein